MSRVYVFEDEAGDFTFRRRAGASRYFIVGTATMTDCRLGDRLLELRRELLWKGIILEKFHATEDKQAVRDSVFQLIADGNVRIDATILDKAKADEYLRSDPARFYKQALYLHMKVLVPKVADHRNDLTVIASSLQIRRKKGALSEAVQDVIDQVSSARRHVTAFHHAAADPCLQIADYATWAIQRKYERGDSRSYDIIRHLVRSEFAPFATRSDEYY